MTILLQSNTNTFSRFVIIKKHDNIKILVSIFARNIFYLESIFCELNSTKREKKTNLLNKYILIGSF